MNSILSEPSKKTLPATSEIVAPISDIRPALTERQFGREFWRGSECLDAAEKTFVADLPGGGQLRIVCRVKKILTGIRRLTMDVENIGAVPVALEDFDFLGGAVLSEPSIFNRVFSESHTMTGYTGIFDSTRRHVSHACLGLSNDEGTHAVVIGFERPDDAFYDIVYEPPGVLRALCHREGISLSPGQALHPSPLLILAGEKLSDLMRNYARLSGEALGVPVLPAAKKAGWCSWYHYYGQETADEILKNAAMIAREFPDRDDIVIQIDDGWNRSTQGPPLLWGDWFPQSKFPQGMRHLSDEIHALGLQAGLWLAPFSVDPASRLAAEHPDWLVRSGESGLLEEAPGGVYGLDLTHPVALDFLEKTFRRVFDEWNYDYVKLDFLIHGILPGKRFDSSVTTAAAFRNALKLIRKIAGDRFILTCGSPLTPAVGIADGMRIGYDVGGRWYVPMNLPAWPHGNCSIKSAAYPSLFRQWMHEHWWQNDPDCIITRAHAVSYEIKKFAAMAGQEHTTAGDFGLSDEEAGFWARLVWMTDGMALLSEVLDELEPERRELALKVFAPSPADVRWVDDYRYPDVCLLQSHNGTSAIGIFNLSESPVRIVTPRGKFVTGKTVLYEWLTGEPLYLSQDSEVEFPEIPPRSARVWLGSMAF